MIMITIFNVNHPFIIQVTSCSNPRPTSYKQDSGGSKRWSTVEMNRGWRMPHPRGLKGCAFFASSEVKTLTGGRRGRRGCSVDVCCIPKNGQNGRLEGKNQKSRNYLVGGFKHSLCSIIYGIILPIDWYGTMVTLKMIPAPRAKHIVGGYIKIAPKQVLLDMKHISLLVDIH